MTLFVKKTGVFPFISMIFLNAFIDLGHKIIIQNTIFKVYDGSTQIILTAIINGLILLPFILLYTPTGYLSDRFKKTKIMQWSAAAAVLITLLITLFYYLGCFQLAFAMTFILAIQSAFYSPAKYGYIRELAGKDNLAAANSFVQATTIVAILLGMLVFSMLFEMSLTNKIFTSEQDIIQFIAPIGWLLVLGSVIELYFSKQIPGSAQPQRAKAFDWKKYRNGETLKHNIKLIWCDPVISLSIIGLSLFWGVSQTIIATFPAYAKEVLDINNTIIIQGLLACSGIGIILGSLVAGKISNDYIETSLIPLSALGMIISLVYLSQASSGISLAVTITAFGLFGGLFIIPLNAIIQFRSRLGQLGTIIAGNNWVQNITMTSFLIATMLSALNEISSQVILQGLTLVTLLGLTYTVLKLPQSLTRYAIGPMFSYRYRIRVKGFHNIPSQGAVLMLGNKMSGLDWAIIQITNPRPVRFVINKSIYEKWYLTWLLTLFKVIDISTRNGNKNTKALINNSLKNGEIVCFFLDSNNSQNEQLSEIISGFKSCTNEMNGLILPFNLRGLWNKEHSLSINKQQKLLQSATRRDITVVLGEPCPLDKDVAKVNQAVFKLSISN